jgi:hypothetical protein
MERNDEVRPRELQTCNAPSDFIESMIIYLDGNALECKAVQMNYTNKSGGFVRARYGERLTSFLFRSEPPPAAEKTPYDAPNCHNRRAGLSFS